MLVARRTWASDGTWRPQLSSVDTEGQGLVTYRIYQHTFERGADSEIKLELDFSPESSEPLAVEHIQIKSTARQVEVYVHDPENGIAAEVGDTDAFTYLQTKRGDVIADVDAAFMTAISTLSEKPHVAPKFFDASIPVKPPRSARVLRLRLLSHKAGGLRDGIAALLFLEVRLARPLFRATPSPAATPAVMNAKPAAAASLDDSPMIQIAAQVAKIAEKRVLGVVNMTLQRTEERIMAKLGALEDRVASLEGRLSQLPVSRDVSRECGSATAPTPSIDADHRAPESEPPAVPEPSDGELNGSHGA